MKIWKWRIHLSTNDDFEIISFGAVSHMHLGLEETEQSNTAQESTDMRFQQRRTQALISCLRVAI